MFVHGVCGANRWKVVPSIDHTSKREGSIFPRILIFLKKNYVLWFLVKFSEKISQNGVSVDPKRRNKDIKENIY